MHKGNRHGVWDLRPFTIYKTLVDEEVNYLTSKESGVVVLFYGLEKALYYIALFICLPGWDFVCWSFVFHSEAKIITSWWSRWIIAVGKTQIRNVQNLCRSHACCWKEPKEPADQMVRMCHTMGQSTGEHQPWSLLETGLLQQKSMLQLFGSR